MFIFFSLKEKEVFVRGNNTQRGYKNKVEIEKVMRNRCQNCIE